MTLECKECGREHEDSTSLNGYCEECVDKFIEVEDRKLKARFEEAGVDLENI